MKKNFKVILATLCSIALFTACSSDDPATPGQDLEQKTYTGTDGLQLTFNGEAMIGKTATFVPGVDGNATITLEGEAINIADLIGNINSSKSNAASINGIPTCGVLPGTPSVNIQVKLEGNEDNCTFNGSSETTYCTFDYAGSISNDKLALSLSNVKLKDTSIAGTWKLPSINEDETSNVARVVWESSKGLDLFGAGPEYEMPIGTVALLMVSMPIIDGATIPELLTSVLKEVTFGTDGNVTAKYCSAPGTPELTSPINIAQYVIKDSKTLLLFINPQAVIANTLMNANKSRDIDVEAIISGLMTNVVPMITNGIPVEYGVPVIIDYEGTKPVFKPDTESTATSFFLNTNTLLPILKTVAPIFNDEDVINSIIEAAASNPDFGSMAPMLKVILKSVPEIVNGTTRIEIGINLEK